MAYRIFWLQKVKSCYYIAYLCAITSQLI